MHVFRQLYQEKVEPFMGKPMIKVITGMRRVGKSCFLQQIVAELKNKGVLDSRIIYLDMEDMDFAHLRDATTLHRYIQKLRGKTKETVYLLVDEIQEVQGWEKAVASLHKKGGIDIVLTGSNAHMLSAELATLISGRYVTIPVYPLSFKEFIQFCGDNAPAVNDAFRLYLRYGGMPATFHLERSDELVFQYNSAIFSTILLKDIVKRFNVRNVSLLERMALYLFDNVGQLVSPNSMSRFLKAEGIRANPDTLAEYLGYFCATFVVHRARRYDIRGKRLLEVNDKYYVNDLGMRHSILGFRDSDVSQLLENVVYLELLRRGYDVRVGKTGDLEVDFVATRSGENLYVQVAYLMETAATREREIRPFRSIRDNHPRLVLTMDPLMVDSVEGIRFKNIVNFLLEE